MVTFFSSKCLVVKVKLWQISLHFLKTLWKLQAGPVDRVEMLLGNYSKILQLKCIAIINRHPTLLNMCFWKLVVLLIFWEKRGWRTTCARHYCPFLFLANQQIDKHLEILFNFLIVIVPCILLKAILLVTRDSCEL